MVVRSIPRASASAFWVMGSSSVTMVKIPAWRAHSPIWASIWLASDSDAWEARKRRNGTRSRMEGGNAASSPATGLRPRLSDVPAISALLSLQASRACGGELQAHLIVSRRIISILIICGRAAGNTITDTGQAFPLPSPPAVLTAGPRSLSRSAR